MKTVDQSAVSKDTVLPVGEIPAGTDKDTMIFTIESAIDGVLGLVSKHDQGPIPPALLKQVQGSLVFLDNCLEFQDADFTAFARQKAAAVQEALKQAQARAAKKESRAAKPEVEAPAVRKAEATPKAKPQDQETPETPAPAPAVKQFPYERQERILLDVAHKAISKRLAFVRGDKVEVLNMKSTVVSMINDDGVPPFFLFSPELPEILRDDLELLIKEKRDLLSRRVYIHTDEDDDDGTIQSYFEKDAFKDIISIISIALDGWSRDIVQQGIAGLPSEKKVIGPKTETPNDGLGASLKKVFGFGKSKTAKQKITRKAGDEETNAMKVHRKWKDLEKRNVFYLSQHFSFSILSYVLDMSEAQFTTEFDCIEQIVNQQDEPDVGPVVSNLSRLYKFYDNIFFDLVIISLFQRKNKFDINMLQAACMSQNFVVERLPLTMDELRRRPMDHAKHLIRCLKTVTDDKTLKDALTSYFYVHETIHASKVGKRIQASENYLQRQATKLDQKGRKVIDGCEQILNDIGVLKARQQSDGVFLGEEIQDTITASIEKIISHYQ